MRSNSRSDTDGFRLYVFVGWFIPVSCIPFPSWPVSLSAGCLGFSYRRSGFQSDDFCICSEHVRMLTAVHLNKISNPTKAINFRA
jgi:hypothetical protein